LTQRGLQQPARAKSLFEEKDLIKKKCFLAESRKNKTKKNIEKNDKVI
jgi:hypothetical protein